MALHFLLLVASASALVVSPPRANLAAARARAGMPEASIAVIGGAGASGSEAVLQALERGEEVVALVRSSASSLSSLFKSNLSSLLISY